MLPAACGDCLWLEYGTPPATKIVIIDGGVRATAGPLRDRIAAARRERGGGPLDVELLVVTHIDNDHILGVIELLENPDSSLRVKDIWFNGRLQLRGLPPLPPGWRRRRAAKRRERANRPADLLGGDGEITDDDDTLDEGASPLSPADLLGPQEGDALSKLLETRALPWNRHPLWSRAAVMVPDDGPLPSLSLDGDLKLTLLGPSLARLHDLCTVWSDVLGGDEDAEEEGKGGGLPGDLLGRGDTWPPEWKDGEKRDPSVTNGSSIMLMAEYQGRALLLAGDAHAPDIADALERLRRERNAGPQPLSVAAFKLSHHGSDKNLTQAVMEQIDCSRYLVSTDGSSHRHPDHQALLRILRYSKQPPRILFNYASATTRPWAESKDDVVAVFPGYEPRYPDDPARGLILDLE
jgi:hypothetical protein